jgi:hypothetical protein
MNTPILSLLIPLIYLFLLFFLLIKKDTNEIKHKHLNSGQDFV